MNESYESIKAEILEGIQTLLSDGQLDEAFNICDTFLEEAGSDVDIICTKGLILILKGEMQSALTLLLEARKLNPEHGDTLFNLAHVLEWMNEFEGAFQCYQVIIATTKEGSLKIEANKMAEELILQGKVNIEVDKLKIAIFVKVGMDGFIGALERELAAKYDVKKITVSQLNQIDEGMAWADICWFEWCDELIAYGTSLDLAFEKKIICRLHSYEAFTDMPHQVSWNVVDSLICVAEHIKEFVVEHFSLQNVPVYVIPNGIDPEKWTFKKRNGGTRVAYVGYINYKKGPMLLLHLIHHLVKRKPNLTFHFAGEFQDHRDVLYFNQMISEFKLQEHVKFDGWQSNLNEWLEDKDYILCSSLLESQNLSVMQAMCKGIKPIIHNFVGASYIYPRELVWNDFDEALKLMDEKHYDSVAYKKFVVKNYSIEKESKTILDLIEKVKASKKNVNVEGLISFNHKGTEITFNLPFRDDWVQKYIRMSRSFYELDMLEDIYNRVGTNKIMVDIGANIGNHTVYFSKICKAKQVYSFEPQTPIHEILIKNITSNNAKDNVQVFKMGVGAESSKAKVSVLDHGNYGMSKLENDESGEIEIDTLDRILLGKTETIDLIKIDVEGMEMDVLRGATEIFKKFKPLLYIEAGTDEEYQEVSEYLADFGYRSIAVFNATPTYLYVCE